MRAQTLQKSIVWHDDGQAVVQRQRRKVGHDALQRAQRVLGVALEMPALINFEEEAAQRWAVALVVAFRLLLPLGRAGVVELKGRGRSDDCATTPYERACQWRSEPRI